MKKIFLPLSAFVVFSARAAGPRDPLLFSGEDSNIVISNKTQRYSFEEGEKDHPVIIRQEDKTTYYCSELRAAIPWVESYDGHSSIDKLNKTLDNDCGTVSTIAQVQGNQLLVHFKRVYKHTMEQAAKWPQMLALIDACTDLAGQKVLLKKG